MSAPTWTTCAVPVFAGQHNTHIATGEDYPIRTLAELFAMAPTSRPKTNGLAFIPSSYRDHDARCHRVQQARGQFVALTGDIDVGDHALALVESLVRSFAGNTAWLIYSSPHARPGDRRWRIILPMEAASPFALWYDAQLAFFGFMGAHHVAMDHALARAGQPVYLPNVPVKHGKTGEPLRRDNGAPLYYQRATTGTQAPGLRLAAGPIATGIARIIAQRSADDRARQRIRVEAERKRVIRTQEGGESLIEAFNRANALPDLLAGYGYQQSPRHADDWRSPLQTGESFATRIMGHKWVSLSGSDAAAGVGARSASGCYGDGFDLFAHFDHGGNRGTALRQLRREAEATKAIDRMRRPATPVKAVAHG